MNIRLIDNYRISSDKYNYILIKEDGDRVIHEGYFATLDSLVKHFVNLKVRGFNANSILGLQNSIILLQRSLITLLQPLSDKKIEANVPSEEVISNNTQIDRNMEGEGIK